MRYVKLNNKKVGVVKLGQSRCCAGSLDDYIYVGKDYYNDGRVNKVYYNLRLQKFYKIDEFGLLQKANGCGADEILGAYAWDAISDYRGWED